MRLLLFLLLWRLSLFIVSFFTFHFFPFTPRFPYADIYLIPSKLPAWIWSWANFDGVHYLTIIQKGYWLQFTQAFFPVFPLLIRVISQIVNQNLDSSVLIIVGLLTSFVSFTGATCVFLRLLKLDYPQNITAKIILSLLLFPTSFYFGAFYTESLFLLLVILSFWFSRQKKWWLVGLIGAIASGTRVTGILLLPALLWEQLREFKIQDSRFKIKKNESALKRFLFIICDLSFIILKSPLFYLIPLGLISYMIYLQIFFGDGLYFWHAQSVWGAARSGNSIILPPQTVWRYLKIFVSFLFVQNTETNLFNYLLNSSAFWNALLEFAAFIFGVVGLIAGHKLKVRTSYLLFGWLTLLLPTLTGTFSSLPRYILMIFPLFIVLGNIKSSKLFVIINCVSAVVLVLLTITFLRGLWVA